MRLIQINNLRVFFKYRLFLWSLFILHMYTHMYKSKPFSILFELEQLSAFVFGKPECRGMYCTYIQDRRLPSENIYLPVYMYVFNFFP